MEEIVQYFIVNGELKMTPGKAAAQVAHAATQSALIYQTREQFLDWLRTGQTKIILKGNQEELETLVDEGFVAIRDAGKTELEPGSLTVVCLPPMAKKKAQSYTHQFRLYS